MTLLTERVPAEAELSKSASEQIKLVDSTEDRALNDSKRSLKLMQKDFYELIDNDKELSKIFGKSKDA
jgi:truncated hemoglobin YjbI